jgi:hypothetical protein
MRDRATRPKGQSEREVKNVYCVAHGCRRIREESKRIDQK